MAIWEWGVVERVSTGLVCTEIGLQPVGRQAAGRLRLGEHCGRLLGALSLAS